ncbi:MAG: TrkH family potassium uptake protein [Bacteroidales bacterium]|nr:TrkH family potassium uptake protein [Bacteroidales bacterium]
MILAGVNFTLYVLLLKRNFSKLFANEELKYYLAITFVATLLVFAVLLISKQYVDVELAFRDSLFQTVSILTTTGYATTDYLTWHHAGLAIIILTMFIGASSGSTTGNIKIIRHVLVVKNLRVFIKRMIHPDAVSVVRYNKIIIPLETANNALVFILAYIVITVLSVIIISFTGIDLDTSIGAVVATIGCIGPGIGDVGPTGNYAEFHTFGKYYLTFLMFLGRLEIFTVIILFTRSFWKG